LIKTSILEYLTIQILTKMSLINTIIIAIFVYMVRLFAKSETCKCIANFRLIFLKCNRLKQLMIQSVD
jgi:hypothetical protein